MPDERVVKESFRPRVKPQSDIASTPREEPQSSDPDGEEGGPPPPNSKPDQ